MSAYIPAALIWLALAGAAIYYWRNWLRVGRDPRAGTIIPIFSPPENLSPAALHFVHRMGAAEDIVVHAGALGAIAELVRRRLLRIEGDSVVKLSDGDRAGLQDDLAAFLKAMPKRARKASRHELRYAIMQLRSVHTAQLAGRLWRGNLDITLKGAIGLGIASLAALIAGSILLPGEEGQIVLGGGFLATLPLAAALIVGRSNIGHQRWIALGLAAVSLATLLGFGLLLLDLVDVADGGARALFRLGLFLVCPAIAVAFAAMLAPTIEGRALFDQIEGFRIFLAVADGGRHAIDTAPEPTEDRLDALMPHAIALHVESGWVNALARRLNLGALSS